MKNTLNLILSVILILSISLQANAAASYGIQSYSKENMLAYLKSDNDDSLILRTNWEYMKFVEDFRSNALSLYFLEMTDKFTSIDTKLSRQKYMEVLINIIATYDLDNASDVAKQNKMDNLKKSEDYAMDIVKIGTNALSVMTSNNSAASKLETSIATAIDGVSMLADNTENWIRALSSLETIVQDYSEYDYFLELIEKNADGELKIAASTLHTSMLKAMEIKLNTYVNISDKNFEKFGEFFFSGVFFDLLKQTSEYSSDETLKFFVDYGGEFISKTFNLKSSWELGEKIGILVGNITVGSENLINRLLELMAVYDISIILQKEIINLGKDFTNNYNKTENTVINQYISCSQYLIGCRIRGEYCLYSIVANDAGLLSWFNKQSTKKAKEWYQAKTKKITNIQNNLLKIKLKEVIDIETSIKITTKKSSMNVGDTFIFKATKKGISQNIVWSVSNKKLATINSKTGKLTAKKAGTVTVIVKAGKSKTSVKLKIINKNVLEKGAKESYEVILDQYRQAIKNNFYKNILNGQSDNWDIIGDDVNIEMLSNARYSNKFKIYYAIEDIDNNGIPELVIGAYHGTDKPCYYDIFTYHGNKSIRLFPDREFGYRTNFWINSNGIFQVSWSAGAMSYGYEHYRISSNGYTMKLVESISSRVVDYKDYSVKYYYKKENEKEITEKEYNQIEQDYNNNKNYTLSWIELSNNKK